MTTRLSSQANGYTPPALPAALAAAVGGNEGECGLSKERHATAHANKRTSLEDRLRLIRALGTAVAKGFQKGHSRKIYRLAKHGMFGPKEFQL